MPQSLRPNLLSRKETAFVLWRVENTQLAPSLIIGELQLEAPVRVATKPPIAMRLVPGFTDLWEIPAVECNLPDGRIYHYWFEVSVNRPGLPPGSRVRITDPLAATVDWRVYSPADPSVRAQDRYPASVIQYKGGRLLTADAGGEIEGFAGEPPLDQLPTNNRLVIYELPTAWTRSEPIAGREIGVGAFSDVQALVEEESEGENFRDLPVVRRGYAYLKDLGVNALELLPPADSVYYREWGYGTTNPLAPDFELGFPETYPYPVPNRDLTRLVRACHRNSIRFFADVVMAFGKDNPYLAAAPGDFFIEDPQNRPWDPDALNSRSGSERGLRNGFGATLYRYARESEQPGYDPIQGDNRRLYPARQLMKTALARWIQDFHIDGIRVDSVENIANWDFVEEYKDYARELNKERFAARGQGGADERFLVVGEELSEPLDLLRRPRRRLDGLWHENFKRYIRRALLGESHPDEPSFEATVRKAIDARAFGYGDLTEAVLYLTSHDVEGAGNERLFDYFRYTGVADKEKRIKLAFACLLTAVGIPMILAGEEFADQHDLFDASGNVSQGGGKQVDPVNFSRRSEDWRARVQQYVSRLVHLRTRYDALAVNDVEFIHSDFADGKRVLVWKRGVPGSDKQVVVVANFSDFETRNPFDPGAQYVVPSWPATPPGKHWREVAQDRAVPAGQAGREPIFPWEAKVYALFD